MIIIQKLEDIKRLKKRNELPKDYLMELEKHFRDTYKNIPTKKSIEEFSLKEYGEIVILQRGDDVKNLEEIGLNSEDEGLLGSYPEWVEILDLGETKVYYTCIVRNNENAIVIFSQVGIHNQEIENWLREEAGI